MNQSTNSNKKWYQTIWGLIVGFGILCALVLSTVQLYDRFYNNDNSKLSYEIYLLAYDLSKYTTLIWEAERLKQGASEEALKENGMSIVGLNKHMKILYSEIMLIQPRVDALKLNIDVKTMLNQIVNQILVVFDGKFDIQEVMFKVYSQIYRNIKFHYSTKQADIFFIAVFCGHQARRGIGLFENERVSPYNQLAPKINSKLKKHGFKISIMNQVTSTVEMIREFENLDHQMRLNLKPKQ